MRPGPSRSPRALRAVALAALVVLAGALAPDAAASPSASAHGHAHKPKKKHGAGTKVKAVARKKPPAPPPLPPLEGATYDYDYDGRDVGHPERRWLGRAFVHKKAAALAGQALPVLVFIHG